MTARRRSRDRLTARFATDIDSNVVAFGQQGVYPLDRVASLPTERLRACFQKGTGEQVGKAIVKAQLRAGVTLRVLNLLQAWPMHGPFDVIFCRNVMIYFDQATRERLVSRFAEILAPGGYLCIGHSESLHNVDTPLRAVGKTIYRKTEAKPVAAWGRIQRWRCRVRCRASNRFAAIGTPRCVDRAHPAGRVLRDSRRRSHRHGCSARAWRRAFAIRGSASAA